MTTNIYTKSMQEAGTLPSVGMECLFRHDARWVKGIVVAATKRFIILLDDGGVERVRIILEFKCKAITPPIELIDGKAYQFTYKNKTRVGYYCTDNDQLMFRGGWGRGSVCTNIQLLEVK